MAFIYILVTVAILMSKRYGRRKTLDIVDSSMSSTSYAARAYNSILKMPWCHWFSYLDLHFSQNGLDTTKMFFIFK